MSERAALLANGFGEVLQRIHAFPAFDQLSQFGHRPVRLEVGPSRLKKITSAQATILDEDMARMRLIMA